MTNEPTPSNVEPPLSNVEPPPKEEKEVTIEEQAKEEVDPLFGTLVDATYVYGQPGTLKVRTSPHVFYIPPDTKEHAIFKHADHHAFQNILVLEEGIVFNRILTHPDTVKSVAAFLTSPSIRKTQSNFVYSLGCLPMFGVPADVDVDGPSEHYYGPAMSCSANIYSYAYRQSVYQGAEDPFCYFYKEPLCFDPSITAQEYALMYCIARWWWVILFVTIIVFVLGATCIYYLFQHVLYLLYFIVCPASLLYSNSCPLSYSESYSGPSSSGSSTSGSSTSLEQKISVPRPAPVIHDPMFHCLYFASPVSLVHGSPSIIKNNEAQEPLQEQIKKLFSSSFFSEFNIDDLIRL